MLGVRVFDEGVFRGEIVHVSNIVMGEWGGSYVSYNLFLIDVVYHEIWQADTFFICLLENL